MGAQAHEVWRLRNDAADAWLARFRSRTWRTFGAVGTIRVGVKACCDIVFVRNGWETEAFGV
ncbi:hypothetical protein [Sutterella sp.]|uniref:hypothetical protein n=1 Tax=Sutterella sp. TaxID=1981025 RepID=UPI003FD8C944